MTFDEIMKQALSETIDDRLEQMRTVTPKPKFSLSYRLWERKTLRDLRRNRHNEHWTLKRARYIVAAMTVLLSLLIGGTAYAAVVLIGRFGFEDRVDYSKMLIETHPSDKTTFEEYYGLPEEDGWELVDYNLSLPFTTVNYRRGEKEISFSQNIIDDGNMGQINAEYADVEIISLYTENDGFVLEIRGDWSGIFWIYDGYLLEITGNIDKNEAVNLAYSTKIVDLSKKF